MIARKLRRRPEGASRGLGLWWSFAGALVVFAALVLAIAQNGRQVQVHYAVWQVSIPLIVIVLTTALIAVVLDEAGGLLWRHRRRARIARRSELDELQAGRDRAAPPPLPSEPGPRVDGPAQPLS